MRLVANVRVWRGGLEHIPDSIEGSSHSNDVVCGNISFRRPQRESGIILVFKQQILPIRLAMLSIIDLKAKYLLLSLHQLPAFYGTSKMASDISLHQSRRRR